MSTNAKLFENPVIAALDTCAKRRWPHAERGGESGDVGRTVAVVESAAQKIDADDLSPIETVLAGQALALDVIFEQFARRSARGDILFHDTMKMALRAQSQCRVTLRTLTMMKNPRASKNPAKRTIESAKNPA